MCGTQVIFYLEGFNNPRWGLPLTPPLEEYEKPDPNLHTKLFAKFPWDPYEHSQKCFNSWWSSSSENFSQCHKVQEPRAHPALGPPPSERAMGPHLKNRKKCKFLKKHVNSLFIAISYKNDIKPIKTHNKIL